jgi:hypothetical protein
MSSDATGEIYVITASNGGSVDAMTVIGNATSTGSAASPTKTGSASKSLARLSPLWTVFVVLLSMWMI